MVPRAGQPRRQLEELAAHWPAFLPGISLASQFNSLPVTHWKALRKMSPVMKLLTIQCSLPGKLSIRKKKKIANMLEHLCPISSTLWKANFL